MIPTREQYQAVETLDLSGIAARLVYKEGFEPQRAVQAVESYRKFLRMVLSNPQNLTVPSEDADKSWHHHILNTQAYEEDCQKIFGMFLHHDPEFYNTPAFAKACKETQELAKSMFGEEEIFLDLNDLPENANTTENNTADAKPAWCSGMLKDDSKAAKPAWCSGMLKNDSKAAKPAWCSGMLKDDSKAAKPAWCSGMLKDDSQAAKPMQQRDEHNTTV